MLEPKLFYRKLDHVLHDIGQAAPSRSWFARMVEEIVATFGDELHMENGRVYAETSGGFRLDQDVRSRDRNVEGLIIRRGYRPVDLVLEHGVFLFDPTVKGQEASLENRLGGLHSAAVLVESDPRRILAFGLRPGWDRDYLDFALHTLQNAINQRLRVAHLEVGIDQAAEIQRSLLPAKVPDLAGFNIAARSLAAERVGGDFYDFVTSGPASVYVALGDVSGHGIASALLARDVVTGLRMGTEHEMKITSIVRRLNRVIARSILSTRFVSLWVGELETNGNLFYVNAGHLAPWLFGPRGIRRLRVGGMIVGPVPEASFKRGFDHVDRGDTLVIVSDGLVEREAADGTAFGEEGLEAVASPLAGRPAEEVLEAIFDACVKHGDGAPWKDDASAVVVSREASPAD